VAPIVVPRSAKRWLVVGCVAVAVALTAVTGLMAARRDAPEIGWPASARSAQAGEFAVVQVATTRPDALMAEWRNRTPGARLKGDRKVRPEQPITSFIVFRGCRANAEGRCSVTVDYDLRDPAGHPTALTRASVWDAPPPEGRMLQISGDGVTLGFGRSKPPGDYRLRAQVTDHVAGVTLTTEDVITLIAN
jgi:hypothetical protein